ncbi:MAG: class I SAM-dependent methyltransferase [Methanomicrobiales archaeon]|nr:class I SAM-dependent methyltransferase [Methanomicrobiales archaeon]
MTEHVVDKTQNTLTLRDQVNALSLIITILKNWAGYLVRGKGARQTNTSEMFWDMIAQNFDQQAKDFEETHSRTLANTEKYLKQGDCILDFGCATGTDAMVFAGRAGVVRGIDISSAMIDAAKNKATSQGIGNVHFMQATIFDEQLEQESFDVIVAFNILHFFEDTLVVIQRLNGLLKPGGYLVTATACMGERKSGISFLVSFLVKTRIIPFMKFFRMSELDEYMKRGDFQILETHVQNPLGTEVNYFIVGQKSTGDRSPKDGGK